MNKEDWKRFEEAVGRFAKALNPAAEVLFNHRVPDRETGKPRQCDAWIRFTYGGHWPFSIYVSCKDLSKSGRKLSSTDIDNFSAEIEARGASTGVIYTNTGFSAPAIAKAKKMGIPCCRLYRNEPADIPQAVWIKQYVCELSFAVSVLEKPSPWPLVTWNDVFRYSDATIERTVLDEIVEDFSSGEEKAIEAMKKKGTSPSDWKTKHVVTNETWKGRFVFVVQGHWKAYEAQIEGVLLSGSFSFTDQRFKGSVQGPWIDTQSVHPGEYWTETDARDMLLRKNRIVAVLYGADVKLALIENMGESPVPDPGSSN